MQLLHDDLSAALLLLPIPLVFIMQMSAAWSELDNTTSEEPPNTESIKAAIRQARPFEELKAQVKVAESFLASLERGADRQHTQEWEKSAAQQRQGKASQPKTAAPKAQKSPGEQSPAKQKKTDSRAEALPEPTQQVEALQQPVHPQQPESPEVPEAPPELSPEQVEPAVLTDAVQAQAIAQPPEAALGAAPAQESDPRLPPRLPPRLSPGLPLATAPLHSVRGDDTLSSPQQQYDQPQHTADHNAGPPAEKSASVAATAAAVSEDSQTSALTEQGTKLQKGSEHISGPSLPADSTPAPESITGSSKSAEVESQPALSSSQEAVGEAASRQADGNSGNQEAADAATHAASTASTSFAFAAAAAPAPGPCSMQDFLSFLLPAENPSAVSAMSSRAMPLPAPSSRPSPTEPTDSATAGRQGLQDTPTLSAGGQGGSQAQVPPQPSRRMKPYTTTARAPAAPYRPPSTAPYRPPGVVYDPTQADAWQLSQGKHTKCLPFPQLVPEHHINTQACWWGLYTLELAWAPYYLPRL